MASWPPTLAELRVDIGLKTSEGNDVALQQVLDAAVAFVERVRPGFAYHPETATQAFLPAPTADLRLGTLRYAGRLHTRRRTPDGMVNKGELGVGRVSTGDGDIDRLLRIGRHQIPAVG